MQLQEVLRRTLEKCVPVLRRSDKWMAFRALRIRSHGENAGEDGQFPSAGEEAPVNESSETRQVNETSERSRTAICHM